MAMQLCVASAKGIKLARDNFVNMLLFGSRQFREMPPNKKVNVNSCIEVQLNPH